MKKKILLILLTFGLAIYNLIFIPQKAEAQWVDWANLIPNTMDNIANWGGWFGDISERIADFIDTSAKTAIRMSALAATQAIKDAILGKGGGSAPYVSNWNQYLYLSPQQRTMTYLQGLFNQSTRGRASVSNYEGIGQTYDQYLLKQARATINPKPMTVNLREYATNPNNIFEGNSFKGLNAWLNCPNNPACITIIAQSQYANELQKQTTIAKESTVNGFISKTKNGRIITPAALMQSAFLELDKVGTDLIVNGQEYGDIALGMGVSIAGSAAQAAFGSESSIAAARQRNQPVRFDFTYNSTDGASISARSGNTTLRATEN